jgi:sec-independent protein translocase protein TatB
MESFFGIGLSELIFITIIALIILGPERLPGAIRQVAKVFHQVRALSDELSAQFSEEIKVLEELNPKNLLNEIVKDLDDTNISTTNKAAKQFDNRTAAKMNNMANNGNKPANKPTHAMQETLTSITDARETLAHVETEQGQNGSET